MQMAVKEGLEMPVSHQVVSVVFTSREFCRRATNQPERVGRTGGGIGVSGRNRGHRRG
jgi:hypothetical protein